MAPWDVVLLTEARYENPAHTSDYVENILLEDGLVQKALERQGLRVTRVDWARKDFDWTQARLLLFRTTWDYFHRLAEFLSWLQRHREKRFINPLSLVHWNLDKHYLLDLEERGIAIPPTRFIEARERVSLAELHNQTGWGETVLKPAVSGAGRHTYRLNSQTIPDHEAIFQQMIQQEAMLLQQFQKRVVEEGELSLMYFGGRYSHAIRKLAKPGDFRVQDDFGGTVHAYQPTREEIKFGEKAMAACQPLPVYGRVDMIRDNQGSLAVVELELIEPELWFRFHPPAADELARSIAKELIRT